ncbi:hypothetical protein [Rhizobium sp.]|uniref:hypothetical protein n=1 Tax=Rhizobium sp. TaxID=391 RepID=UPI0028A67474
MSNLQEFASSSNGDKWFVGQDGTTDQRFVLHRGNPSSGGHETRSSVDAFLNQKPFGPERDALIAFLKKENAAKDEVIIDDGQTPSRRLAEEYMRLGGRRRAKVDDNLVSTRNWEDEPALAAAFWNERIGPMDEKQRREVELHLPSMTNE